MKIGIPIFIIMLLIIWLSVDFYYGRKKHQSSVKKRTFPERQSNFELYTKGKELTEQLFLDFQKAKHYIHVQFFIVKNDKISLQFSNLLKKKAEQGLEVRLLIDWVGGAAFPVNIRDELKKSGVKFSLSDKPKWPYFFYSLQKRNHRKICVIDGEIGYIGGFNIGKEYVNGDKKLNPWHDYHLRLKGEGIRDLENVFIEDWYSSTGEDIQYKDVYIRKVPQGRSLHRFFLSDGAFLEEEYVALFRCAEEAITIASPYFIPSDQLIQELMACLDRGVSLDIIVPFISDHFLVKEAAYPSFRKLIPAGANVYQYQKGFFHGKYIMIDNKISDIGTANFDKRSLFLNREINCYIYDSIFIQQMQKQVSEDLTNSQLLTLSDLEKLGLWSQLKERIAARFSFFF